MKILGRESWSTFRVAPLDRSALPANYPESKEKCLIADLSTGFSAFVIPLKPGHSIPPISAGGFRSAEDARRVPGVRVFDVREAELGPSRGIYSWFQESIQRNLYRIPLD